MVGTIKGTVNISKLFKGLFNGEVNHEDDQKIPVQPDATKEISGNCKNVNVSLGSDPKKSNGAF